MVTRYSRQNDKFLFHTIYLVSSTVWANTFTESEMHNFTKYAQLEFDDLFNLEQKRNETEWMF